jgi:hypothetical protein
LNIMSGARIGVEIGPELRPLPPKPKVVPPGASTSPAPAGVPLN